MNPNGGTSLKSGQQIVATSTPIGIKATNKSQMGTMGYDDLNLAIESILNDSNELDSSGANGSQKMVTNFELVAQSKSTPLKTSLINPMQKATILGAGGGTATAINFSQSNLASGTKIKMIPSNQFVQLKPPMQSQSKIYTIKTSGMLNSGQSSTSIGSTASIGSIVQTTQATTGQQQIFTLKSPDGQTTQFVTAAPAAAQQKYTVVKNASGGTSLQLTGKPSAAVMSATGSSVDLSNIIDMPIVFADNEGNISDSVANETVTSRKPGKSEL